MQRKHLALLLIPLFALMFLGQPARVSAAAAITGPNELRIGFPGSFKITGLTVGSNYVCIAAHSDANVSHPFTASTSTEYCRFTFTTADTDGIVPVHISSADAAGAESGPTTDTMLVTLINPTADIPSSFLQQILPGMVLIGVFVILMSSLLYGLKLKFRS